MGEHLNTSSSFGVPSVVKAATKAVIKSANDAEYGKMLAMEEVREAIQNFFESFFGSFDLGGIDLSGFPSLARIVDSMDPVAWTLFALLTGAVALGIFFSINTQRTFLQTDDVETTPEMLLARLKQDPTQLNPAHILSRLGAEATLELMEYGDRVDDREWIYKWASIRNELLYLLSQQNAFGPVYALAQYYRSSDQQEPDSLRIRRTALIHKLGLRRHLEPNADGLPAELRVRCHPAEVVGDLGFVGSSIWLIPDEPAKPPKGPLIEMDPIVFRTLEEAELNLNIRRTPMSGGGFRLLLEKRRNMWIVKNEEIEWAS